MDDAAGPQGPPPSISTRMGSASGCSRERARGSAIRAKTRSTGASMWMLRETVSIAFSFQLSAIS